MKSIVLTQGKKALVDNDDYELLAAHNWYAAKRGYGFYAQRVSKRKVVQMHRVVMNAKKGEEIDHINGNTLDNRKGNLRKVTRSQNEWNRKKQSNNTSGYKGVIFSRDRYVARIKVLKKVYYLGAFKDKKEAALAYNYAALKYHGEFALLNKI